MTKVTLGAGLADMIFTSTHQCHDISADMQDLTEIGNALSRLIVEVRDDIKNNKDVWNRIFSR